MVVVTVGNNGELMQGRIVQLLFIMNTLDYTITMQDRAGCYVVLSINGASLDELIRGGYSMVDATECLESNAFGAAIDNHQIGADAWLVTRTQTVTS